jgi:tetratricopeptide (TPR) repeat protein
MLRRLGFIAVFAFAVLFVGSVPAFAQVGPVSGIVELKDADGNVKPLAGALVEIFRSDIKTGGLSDKTDKNGRFSFAGVQLGGEYILSVSGPGAAPQILPGIKAYSENLKFTLLPGDGKQLTEEEVRASAAQPSTPAGELSEEQKKAQAEYEAKVKEVEAKNKRAMEVNAIIEASLKSGNEAFNAKNYDLAVTKYDEGINADPNFLGSAPVLLNNKGVVLKTKAVDTFNAGVKETDRGARAAAMESVQKDLRLSFQSFYNAWRLLSDNEPGSVSAESIKEQKVKSMDGARETMRLMAQTEKVDPAQIDNAKIMTTEYTATESDSAKKAAAKVALGDLYRITGDSAAAIGVYREAVALERGNIDAMAGLGLSLFADGAAEEDRAKMQEGLNYMQAFTEKAPDTHRLKSSVRESIDYLKTDLKMTPQKLPGS